MDPISSPIGIDRSDLEKSEFHKVKGERFMIYCNCPISAIKLSRYKTAVFTVMGNPKKKCDLHIVSNVKLKHSNFTVMKVLGKDESLLKDIQSTDLMLGYQVDGDATVKIKWN